MCQKTCKNSSCISNTEKNLSFLGYNATSTCIILPTFRAQLSLSTPSVTNHQATRYNNLKKTEFSDMTYLKFVAGRSSGKWNRSLREMAQAACGASLQSLYVQCYQS